MAKTRTSAFFCQECGYESAKWLGQCPGCRAWNTFVEETVSPAQGAGTGQRRKSAGASVKQLNQVSLQERPRLKTGFTELDRVLGGGIVNGSLILVGGDPGIGKSTLLLQVCRNLAADAGKVLYVSGEESLQQIRMRADRMGSFSDRLLLLCETDMEAVTQAIASAKPAVVVIDSIQTMYNSNVTSAPGSVSQVRETTGALMQTAKTEGISIFIVGHVTKEGVVAGPRVLEHMVDTVLYFEGDRHASYRVLRGVKNRFGSTNEIGVFEMREEGLVQVPNPSEYMLEGKPQNASGSVVVCAMEGTRPILLEIQALACRSNMAFPRRTADGTELNRLNLLLAVIEKRLGLNLSSSDVYVNVAGGIRLTEPAADLGIVAAVISSSRDIVVSGRTIIFGEVGLSGEVRSVSMASQRVMEARKLGFDTVILPETSARAIGKADGITLKGVKNVRELYSLLCG